MIARLRFPDDSPYSDRASCCRINLALAELVITGVCDGISWTPRQIEFVDTGVVALWVAGLPLDIGINSIDVLLDEICLNVEYLEPAVADQPRQINARLPEFTSYGRHSIRVVSERNESAAVDVEVVSGRPNPALRSFVRNLHDEKEGVRYRTEHFYLPLFRRFCRENQLQPDQVKILDCGCGNGVAVEELCRAGFNAYGIDDWRLRLQQWSRLAPARSGFCLASALHLPFREASFDIVMNCGVLEHIGVNEAWTPTYSVSPSPNQRECRRTFISECLRVLRRPGVLYVDHPNGAFPIDFWHPRDHRNLPRWHWPSERFLPTVSEVRNLVRASDERATVRAISPAHRFTYTRTGRRWHGRVLRAGVEGFFRLIRNPPFEICAESPLNPYLVLQVTRR